MNFTDEYKWLRDSEMWFFQTCVVWVFTILLTVFLFVLVSGETTGILLPNWLFLSTIPVACVLSNWMNYIRHIRNDENAKYSRFKFGDFKKWYSFRPERFIFESACVLYFIAELCFLL